MISKGVVQGNVSLMIGKFDRTRFAQHKYASAVVIKHSRWEGAHLAASCIFDGSQIRAPYIPRESFLSLNKVSSETHSWSR
jgi:hypothetical protein